MVEYSELKEIFEHFDKDDNGRIDFEEFKQLMTALGHEADTEELKIGFSIIDTNASKTIDFDEFFHWWSSR